MIQVILGIVSSRPSVFASALKLLGASKEFVRRVEVDAGTRDRVCESAFATYKCYPENSGPTHLLLVDDVHVPPLLLERMIQRMTRYDTPLVTVFGGRSMLINIDVLARMHLDKREMGTSLTDRGYLAEIGIDPLDLDQEKRTLTFSLIHATRGRAQTAATVWEKWKKAASGEHAYEYIVSLDEDDVESQKIAWPPEAIVVIGPDGGGSVPAYNRGFWRATGDVIVQLQDDLDPPQLWDTLIASRLDPDVPQLLRVSDSTNLHARDALPPLTVLIGTRPYFLRYGCMYHPSYTHCCGDRDHAVKGHKENIVVDARDITFAHRWPGKTYDDVACRNYGDESIARGRAALHERWKAGFPDCPELWPKEK